MNVESHLRRRIDVLTDEEREILLKQAESLYYQCRCLNTDDFYIHEHTVLGNKTNKVIYFNL